MDSLLVTGVAFYRDPRTRKDAFMVQGDIDRDQIAGAVHSLIELLDVIDGDPDFEGECSEDEISRAPDFGSQFVPSGPGCEISDPDCAVDDIRCDGDEGV